ncbi:class I SAM-dependent methyltransferase [Taibaiella koreensis]|uniref:class I SAM-dependent methyltransferase n=1 Tax=Taibaiella koreensis TaxID=1268548 RepID=UPI000E59D045|nr:class I SAM-dependent methyltransferase [Taibaiella koreensis]
MEITEAVSMLQCPLLKAYTSPVCWADLGCGSGVFTRALAALLPAGSSIHAVDQTAAWTDPGNLAVTVNFQQRDFVTAALDLPPLDGILMANALHYVRDQPAFLARIKRHLKPGAVFLIVEYDTDTPAKPWVPYPLSFDTLSILFRQQHFSQAHKLQERPSVYRRARLYSALISP